MLYRLLQELLRSRFGVRRWKRCTRHCTLECASLCDACDVDSPSIASTTNVVELWNSWDDLNDEKWRHSSEYSEYFTIILTHILLKLPHGRVLMATSQRKTVDGDVTDVERQHRFVIHLSSTSQPDAAFVPRDPEQLFRFAIQKPRLNLHRVLNWKCKVLN